MSRPKVAVVGYPNVGKSSLVNRLSGGREAVVHERAGRHPRPQGPAVRVERAHASPSSTPAGWTRSTPTRSPARSASRRRRRSPRPPSPCSSSTPAAACAPATRSSPTCCAAVSIPVIVVANKVDRVAGRPPRPPSSTGSGLGEPLPVSAAQGLGTGDLLDRIVELLPPADEEGDEDDDDTIRLAIIGRPNVGKSTFVNRVLGEERVIVSDVAGTTRDAIDLPVEVDGRRLVLVDTAGIRRQAKVTDNVEYYTVLRSQRAVERADVALVICDARDGVTSQDLRIAELAMKEGCATLLALNKWDLAPMSEDDLDHERAKVNAQAAPAPEGHDDQRARAGATSRACSPRRSRSATAGASASRRPGLNRFLAEAIDARQPPSKQGHRLKLLYLAQIETRPPRFALQVNNRNKMTRDYAYYLENRLRARYGLDGVPVIIDVRERKDRRSER